MRVAALILRSIPACAGEPANLVAGLYRKTVYPRVCGGTVAAPENLPWLKGLSPRVRGNRGVGGNGVFDSGSIPACAGEPPPGVLCRTLNRVYPRVCGGTPKVLLDAQFPQGLSPRVRGNPHPSAW